MDVLSNYFKICWYKRRFYSASTQKVKNNELSKEPFAEPHFGSKGAQNLV